jgi:hypothetical protein
MSKRTSYGKIYCPDDRFRRPNIRARPCLPHGCVFYPRTGLYRPRRWLKMRPRRRGADALTRLPPPLLPSVAPSFPPSRLRGCSSDARKNYFYLKLFFLVVVAPWKREKEMFDFRFSIPEILELPKLRGLRGRSREKKKVFLT